METPDAFHPAGCVLGGRAPCPPDCAGRGRCAAVRLRLRDRSESVGIPLGVVGDTLRFLQVLPGPAIRLLALEGLEPESADLALFRIGEAPRPELAARQTARVRDPGDWT